MRVFGCFTAPSLDAPAKPATADKPAPAATATDSTTPKQRSGSVSGSQFSFLSAAAEAASSTPTDPAPPAGGGFGLDFTGLTIKSPASNAGNKPAAAETGTGSASAAYNLAASAPLSTDSSTTPVASAAPPSHHHSTDSALPVIPAGGSSEQKANAIRSRLEAALSAHWKHIADVTAQQNALRVKELTLDGSLRSATNALAVADAQQQKASESEEFDKAEHLERVMEDTKKEMSALSKQLVLVRDQSKQLESNKLSGAKQCVTTVKECITQLSELAKAQSTTLQQFITTRHKAMDAFDDKWNADHERIDRVLKHVAGDLEAVLGEESAVEQAITEATKDVLADRAQYQMEEDKIKSEIEQLKKQLIQKEQELVGVREKLDTTNKAISAARVGHERKLNRITEKKDRIKRDQKSAQDEMQALEASRRVWEADTVKTKNEQKAYKAVLNQIQFQIKVCASGGPSLEVGGVVC